MTDKDLSKVVPFSGKKSEWMVWEEKFMARAMRKGYKQFLDGSAPVFPYVNANGEPMVFEDGEGGDAGRLSREMNELGYAELIMSIDTSKPSGKVAFSIVKSSKSFQYPNGHIGEAWRLLKRKYVPATAPTLAKLNRNFYGAALKRGVDPDVFLTYMEDLRVRMSELGSEMTDDQFILHILNNLGKDYESQVERIEDRIGDAENPLTIEDMREVLNLRFERMNIRETERDEFKDYGGEKALIAVNKQFKGRCYNCGKYGHKGAECRNKEGAVKNSPEKGKRFDGACFYCGKQGHRKSECRKFQADQRAGPKIDI
jgi:hypothetical protein